MKCNEFKNAIWDYIDGKPSAAMERHALECAECRSEAERCRALLKRVGELAAEEFPPGLHERIMRRIREEAARKPIAAKKHKYMRLASGIAAALVITFIGVLTVRNGLVSGDSAGGAEQQYALSDTAAQPESAKGAAERDTEQIDTGTAGTQATDAPYSMSIAPTAGALEGAGVTGALSNVLNAPLSDRERVEAYLATNAIPFDEADGEIYAYAYGEQFDALESFLVNELGIKMPEHTDNQYRTTIVFE